MTKIDNLRQSPKNVGIRSLTIKERGEELVSRVGKHVYRRNGVITDLKSLGTVQLGYGIKKLDGRYYQGQLMQMTMMTPPSFNSELHYLNKEDRLLRWLLVKHRDIKFGVKKMMMMMMMMWKNMMQLSNNRTMMFDFDKF
ncbi:unnamed protein product [Lactuca saligna]|uniref:Uncharacterized protein n=1 Tax=Lactuca saligna TaxID=75948 RepID=A0AA35V1D8_LACSI|nr:unnamed protein product [Lactuca saligna]